MNEPRLMGNGEGHTVLILTDAESRLIRGLLGDLILFGHNDGERAFNRGIQRGTERLQAEAKASSASSKR